jgi:hypothetical protein
MPGWVFPATVVATLLVVDAWFDVTTSATAKAATGVSPITGSSPELITEIPHL